MVKKFQSEKNAIERIQSLMNENQRVSALIMNTLDSEQFGMLQIGFATLLAFLDEKEKIMKNKETAKQYRKILKEFGVKRFSASSRRVT